MKNVIAVLLLMCLVSSAKALDLSANVASFLDDEQPYVELYLQIIGKTLNYQVRPDSQMQAAVDVLILFKQNDQIIKFDKYRINSPVSKMALNFYNQKRYPLPVGDYVVEISVSDANKPDNKAIYNQKINLQVEKNKIQQSDIQLLAAYYKDSIESDYSKNGYRMEMLPFNFCDKNYSTISFYNEIYHSKQVLNDNYQVSYLIEQLNGKGEAQLIQVSHKRKTAADITPILMQMDISQLASGNYRLAIEVRSKLKELLSRREIPFQRSNPYLNFQRDSLKNEEVNNEFVSYIPKDSLRYSLKAIAMNVPDGDVQLLNSILLEADTQVMRRYLLSYWLSKNNNQPGLAYNSYMEVARAIDTKYRNGFGYGFESDRGRIYMRYGQPDDMVSAEQEADAPPYEIWTYYDFKMTKQTNVKFVFFNPDLVNNGFILLHSTARGERNNPRWQKELYRDALNEQGSDDWDGTRAGSGVNREANRLFNDN